MSASQNEKCSTCYGEGSVPSEHGQLTCADCAGTGLLPSGLVRTEWRLRELERIYTPRGGDVEQEILWLASEVRRAHHALVQILAASDDTDEQSPTLSRIKFLANDVLGMYPTTKT